MIVFSIGKAVRDEKYSAFHLVARENERSRGFKACVFMSKRLWKIVFGVKRTTKRMFSFVIVYSPIYSCNSCYNTYQLMKYKIINSLKTERMLPELFLCCIIFKKKKKCKMYPILQIAK